jgi:tRNA threonylcarbamoyl adenosine modification protein (Sua5/YciO/YrdC/YwlC family)
MKSAIIVKVDPLNPQTQYLEQAAEVLKAGGLVIIPTETVYGIAVNMLDTKAVERLYALKERPKNKPFSLHIAEQEKISEFATEIPVAAYKLMKKFWPGPLTLIFKSQDSGTIGIRLPDNRIARQVIALAGVPVACPSANITGSAPATNFPEAILVLREAVDFAIDAGETKLKTESTIVDVSVRPPRLLREGWIKNSEIERITKSRAVLFVCTGNSCRSVMAQALLQKALRDKNREDVEVFSAGISAVSGMGATEEVRELLSQEGINVNSHRARLLTKDMLDCADFILAMDRRHEERILQMAPQVKNRLFLLKEFAKIQDKDLGIPDPMGGSQDSYRDVIMVIKEAVQRITEII